jgi:phosphatidylserine/phosphatidylglycerophosphate/cardiolipin synthase-like enzyme
MSAPSTTLSAPADADAPMRMTPVRPRRRPWRRGALLLFLAVWGGVAYWHTHKALPRGTRLESGWRAVPAANVAFIADITAADAYGRPVMSQAIFDEVLGVVRGARRFLVLDYFLFNSQRGSTGAEAPARALSSELRDALLAQKRANPDLRVLFVTDPINDVYGGSPSADLEALRAAGIDVVVTDLNRLRDSNYLYSSLWRLGIGWWNNGSLGEGWLPNPLEEDSQPVTFGSWARLANFKANHRKVIIGDDGNGQLVGIVASANPHDASSAHSNVAARIAGPALAPLLASELDVARFSGWQGVIAIDAVPPAPPENSSALSSGQIVRTQVITEGAIRRALVERIDSTVRGESIDIAMFYISDRPVIDALVAASSRGVNVRLVLDPNKDAFGHEKNGIPNRPVASELVAASDGAIHVRWYRTHGEQFHTKLVLIYGSERVWMTLGSANLTRRNIGDYNLEANVAIEAARNTPLGLQVLDYFETLWSNRAALGIEYTADYGVYADPSQGSYWLYRVMESTGLSTF